MKLLFPSCKCISNKHTVVANDNTETSLAQAQTQEKKWQWDNLFILKFVISQSWIQKINHENIKFK